VIVRDWRSLAPGALAPWYAEECRDWQLRYSWDTARHWIIVEAARLAGSLPGVVVSEQDRAAGWCFYLPHRGTLQIGALRAVSEVATRALVDAVLRSPEAGSADAVMAFLPALAPGLPGVLADAAFDLQPFQYLCRALGPEPCPAAGPMVGFSSCGCGKPLERLADVARLLARAYPGADAARPFAPGGGADEWDEYVERLAGGVGCGTWLPGCTVLVRQDGDAARLAGAILATDLGTGTAHLAQVAVDPACQGRGLGRSLVEAALARLAAAGYARVTLLVSAHNARAVGLYGRLGFRDAGTFVSAVRSAVQPRPSTSAACSTGGVSTRR
jgi:ribosomal protein S18 acetylase RimI-like enzyme